MWHDNLYYLRKATRLYRRRKHGKLTPHKHSARMWACLDDLENEKGKDAASAHAICYTSVGKAKAKLLNGSK